MRAVVFDGVEIPESLLAQEVQNHPGASAAEAREAAAHALAIKALLLARAHELGLEAQPERDDQGREETAEEALVRAVLDQEVDCIPPTEAECQRVFDANPARFCTQPLFEASHILIEPRGEEPEAVIAAQAAAEAAIAALAEGRARFADLAKELSDCPSGALGGSLGQLQPGDVVSEVERALTRLASGEVAPAPVRSRFGWHVLKLDRRVDGRPLPFHIVEPTIRLHLESRAWTAAATRYVSALADEARARGVALTALEDGGVAEGSRTLGDFLGDGAAAHRLEPWLAATDADLHARTLQAAEAAGQAVPEFVNAAVAEFISGGTDEAWTQLISAAQGAQDPALACLAALLRSRLTPAKRSFTLIRRT